MQTIDGDASGQLPPQENQHMNHSAIATNDGDNTVPVVGKELKLQLQNHLECHQCHEFRSRIRQLEESYHGMADYNLLVMRASNHNLYRFDVWKTTWL